MENFNQDDHTKNKGAAVDATTPDTTTTNHNFKDNSTFNQCLKMLDWLLERNSITTDQARELLDIMPPAGRIKSLREAGYLIVTIWVTWKSEHGINHRIAKYVLQQKEPVENALSNEVAA